VVEHGVCVCIGTSLTAQYTTIILYLPCFVSHGVCFDSTSM